MRQYQTAVRAMEADIAKWYQRFADANGITLAEAGRLLNSDELLEFQWTVEDYIRSGQQNAVSGAWMKELESASARVHISRLDSLKMSLRQHVEELIGMQLKTLPEVLHATYRESYDRTVYELSRGSRVMLSYQKPDVRRIDRVLGTPWSSDGKEFSERVWNNRAQLIGSMNTHLTQSIIRGEDPQKAINAIAKDMNVSKRRAGTLVMTESAAIATAAQRDCYKDLDVEEFEYVCTLDEVTCPVCGAMDGKHFPMSKYEIGVNVPPMHPNCRCATAPYFDDMDDWGAGLRGRPLTKSEAPTEPAGETADRAARDENGKTVSVPANMTYEQWKQAQDAKFGEGYIERQRKMRYNESADRVQYDQYAERLGKKVVGSFEDFRRLKYGNSDEWDNLQLRYRYKGIDDRLLSHVPSYQVLERKNGVPASYNGSLKLLNDRDREVILAYTDGNGNCSAINTFAATGKEITPKAKKDAEDLHAALSKMSLPRDTVVFRGTKKAYIEGYLNLKKTGHRRLERT